MSEPNTTLMKEGIRNVINGLEQIKRELAADLGNIHAPIVSRTKKNLISETIGELNVLISNLRSLEGQENRIELS